MPDRARASKTLFSTIISTTYTSYSLCYSFHASSIQSLSTQWVLIVLSVPVAGKKLDKTERKKRTWCFQWLQLGCWVGIATMVCEVLMPDLMLLTHLFLYVQLFPYLPRNSDCYGPLTFLAIWWTKKTKQTNYLMDYHCLKLHFLMTNEVEHYLKNIRHFFLCTFWQISSHFFPYEVAEDFIGAGGDTEPFSR